MKNIHLLPTDKPSRLYLTKEEFYFLLPNIKGNDVKFQNIAITNDEEIKKGDWWLNKDDNKIYHSVFWQLANNAPSCKKIILTTDQDLIKDGVQAINDDFLEWFVKNQSCEWVEVIKQELNTDYRSDWKQKFYYKIIIPSEERERGITITHKQETLEEVAERLYPENIESIMDGYHDSNSYQRESFINGYKLAQERSYNEEEVLNILKAQLIEHKIYLGRVDVEDWFEQFKNK